MTPFFSVVIPLYNKENYIEDTLRSVFNQTFQDFEIIIVNDGSTDNSLIIAKKLTHSLGYVSIINQKNKGLSATRNKGISVAKGSVISLLDADDVWHIDFLNEIKKLHNQFPKASLYGTDYLEKYSDNNILEIRKNLDKSLKGKSFIVKDFFKANWFQPIINPSCFAFKKEVFKTTTFNEKITFAEDIDFYINSNLKYQFAYCYKALVTINFSIPNQMTSIGFKGKQIPDFDFYEKETKNHPSLKKYLDYNRYYLLINTKLTTDIENYNLLLKHLDIANLSIKQKILLKSPIFILKTLRWIKKILLKNNLRLTSY